MSSLSREIYHSVLHFTLELIQNANDAKFSKTSSHVPTLACALNSVTNRRVVRCNQIGFMDADVRRFVILATAVKPWDAQTRRIRLRRKAFGSNPTSCSTANRRIQICVAVADNILNKTRALGTVCRIFESEFLNERFMDHDDTVFELFLSLEDLDKSNCNKD